MTDVSGDAVDLVDVDSQAFARGASLYGQQLSSKLESVLADAMFAADPLLRCCIITAVKCQGLGHLKDRVEQALEDIHPVVRDTAEWALDTWADKNCPSFSPSGDRPV